MTMQQSTGIELKCINFLMCFIITVVVHYNFPHFWWYLCNVIKTNSGTYCDQDFQFCHLSILFCTTLMQCIAIDTLYKCLEN